jgi:hypothetical protein
MSAWLEPLRQVLDTAPGQVELFFRDDDAGWADERLQALLALFERHATPLDLAVIPTALSSVLAHQLRARMRDTPSLLGVHQHGYAHSNHETNGRKCEFGPARARDRQRRDLAAGAALLREQFALRADPIFTPPWNRCSAATVECLVELGCRALSRDRGAAPLDLRGLCELPVDIDWCKSAGSQAALPSLGRTLATSAASGRPAGVMLHHAVMTDAQLEPLGELLRLLSRHPASRCSLMRQLALECQSH